MATRAEVFVEALTEEAIVASATTIQNTTAAFAATSGEGINRRHLRCIIIRVSLLESFQPAILEGDSIVEGCSWARIWPTFAMSEVVVSRSLMKPDMVVDVLVALIPIDVFWSS